MPQFCKPENTNEDGNAQVPSDSIETAPEMPSTSSLTSSSSSSKMTYTKSSKLPQHIHEMKRSGNEFMENEKYLQAINQYGECIKRIPNHPVFYLNRATAYMRRNWYGDMYAGLRDCQQALQLDPTYVKAHFRLARALFELGFVMEASDCLDELKKRFPDDANNKQIQLLSQDIKGYLEVRCDLHTKIHVCKTVFYYSKIDLTRIIVKAQTQNCRIKKWLVTFFVTFFLTFFLTFFFDIFEFSNFIIDHFLQTWRTNAKDYAERFVGHCNTTTDIKEANFFGADGAFIVAG